MYQDFIQMLLWIWFRFWFWSWLLFLFWIWIWIWSGLDSVWILVGGPGRSWEVLGGPRKQNQNQIESKSNRNRIEPSSNRNPDRILSEILGNPRKSIIQEEESLGKSRSKPRKAIHPRTSLPSSLGPASLAPLARRRRRIAGLSSRGSWQPGDTLQSLGLAAPCAPYWPEGGRLLGTTKEVLGPGFLGFLGFPYFIRLWGFVSGFYSDVALDLIRILILELALVFIQSKAKSS